MTVPVPLSVVIIAKNEQGRIKDCLESVHGWVDEIVVVDDESADDTRAIAAHYTDKIFSRRMELEGKQRNFGALKVKNDWILLLDCDERLTDELKIEIAAALTDGDPKIVAYWAPQINYFGDVPLNHGGWSNPHIRLYNKNYVRCKLFVSPVKPSSSHAGPSEVPLSTAVRTCSVDPLLKLAWSPPPSPNTLNSAICQWLPRSGK